jgi:hypothetical protein
MKFFTWIKGAFEDQAGTASSKRVILYWSMFLLTYMVTKSIGGVPINMEVFWGIVGLVLAGLGLVTSEFFKSKPMS